LEELERQEAAAGILQALARLPERERTVFELYAVEGFSKEEVASIFGLSATDVPLIVDKVKTQVLQQLLESRNSEDSDQKKAS
jgi:RNA polymerase sigma factor (sigma-70 family)